MKNFERAFAERPEVFDAWLQLNGAIKAGMDMRRYELATLAAAKRLRSSYCCLAHGTVLVQQFGDPVRDIAIDHRAAERRGRHRSHGSRGEGRRRPRRRSATPTCSLFAISACRRRTSWTSFSRRL